MSHVYICPSSFLSKWDTVLAIPNVAIETLRTRRCNGLFTYLPAVDWMPDFLGFLFWSPSTSVPQSCSGMQPWALGSGSEALTDNISRCFSCISAAMTNSWQTWRSSLGGWNYWLTILEHSVLLWGRQGRDSSNSSTVKGRETRGTYSRWFFIEIELYHFPSPFPPSSSPSWASLNPTPSLHSQVDSLFFFDYHCECVYMHKYI